MGKYLKREIMAMQCAITGYVAMARNYAKSDTIRLVVQNRRADIVREGVEEARDRAERRAKEYRASAEHFRTHPDVYGKSTHEMIERFSRLAVDEEKDEQICAALLAKLTELGLPEEVTSFDPLEKVRA